MYSCSSLHRLAGLPQVVVRIVHRLSRILVTCPAQVHFVFWLVKSFLWPLSFLLPICLFLYPGMGCLTYSFPSLFVPLLACFLLGWWMPIFCAVWHRWKYAWIVDLSLQARYNVTVENVAVLGECNPSDRDSWISLSCFFVFDVVSLSLVNVTFNVFDLSVVDIY